MEPLRAFQIELHTITEEEEDVRSSSEEESTTPNKVEEFIDSVFEEEPLPKPKLQSTEEEHYKDDVNDNTEVPDSDDEKLEALEEEGKPPSITISEVDQDLIDLDQVGFGTADKGAKVKFVLHPRLYNESLSSCVSCVSSASGGVGVTTPDLADRSETESKLSQIIDRNLKATSFKELCRNGRFRSSTKRQKSNDNDFEITVESKPVEEILYDIATGKWPSKSLVIDDEIQGIRKVESRPCSNASCVLEAERFERRKRREMERQQMAQDPQFYEADDEKESNSMLNNQNNNSVGAYEDGKLPSYHSMITVWNETSKYSWEKQVFHNGYPRTEEEFLAAWRACRRNPEAFGVRIRTPQDLPHRKELREESKSRTSAEKLKVEKEILKSKEAKKSGTPRKAPVRLGLRDLYSNDGKGPLSPEERKSIKARYEEFQKMYPHLRPLRPVDYKINPTTVRIRLKQAEEWHRLISVNNDKYKGRRKFRKGDEENGNGPGERLISTPDLTYDGPRYAATTTSYLYKMKQKN